MFPWTLGAGKPSIILHYSAKITLLVRKLITQETPQQEELALCLPRFPSLINVLRTLIELMHQLMPLDH